MERYEIKIAPWKTALLIAGLLAFSVGGALIAFFADSMVEKAAGVLSVLFFGFFGGYALYKKSQGQGRLVVRGDGIEITMFGPKLRFIPWSDIEDIGMIKLASQEMTAIRLASYRPIIEGLSDQEINTALKEFGALRALSYATVGVGFANKEFKDSLPVLHFAAGSGKVKSLADMLLHMRQKYGAEIMLPWNLRDRSASDFAKFLKERRVAAGF